MVDISEYTNAIRSAVYGEEVRGSIIDAIEKINEERQQFDKFYRINIADMIAKNIYTVTKGAVETIEEGAKYAVSYLATIEVGSWNQQTGELTPNFNTDFGIDKLKTGDIWIPTLNAGDSDIWYDSDMFIGNIRSIDALIQNGELPFGSHADLLSITFGNTLNKLKLYITQKVYFDSDPTSWGWEEVREFLAGDDQLSMGYAVTIGLRVNVPKAVNVGVIL